MSGFLLLLLLLALVVLLIAIGYGLARERCSAERDELEDERDVLATEWAALEQARRINEVFYDARDQLRRAERDARRESEHGPPSSGPSYQPPQIIEGEWF